MKILIVDDHPSVREGLASRISLHCCHKTLGALFDACNASIDGIHQAPIAVVNRLWPKTELDPDFEKLLVSE